MTSTEPDTKLKDGRVVTVAGPVVDVEFPPGAMPEINTCLSMTIDDGGVINEIRAEVAQQIGDGRVRAICLKPTDGLRRGQAVVNTGAGITVPVGDKVLGHVFNVIGEPLDITSEELGEVDTRWEIHRDSPTFDAQEPSSTVMATQVLISGSALGGNSMSTTGPAMVTTRPSLRAVPGSLVMVMTALLRWCGACSRAGG